MAISFNNQAPRGKVTKRPAACIVCGASAGVYEARCRACFRPYLEAPESEQMELPDAQLTR